MTFPMGQDYADAVQNLKQCILDPEFTGGVARKANGRLEVYSGGFSRVFPITVSRQVLALRCWTADVGDAEVRYREITSYLSSLKRDYFADFHYVRRGIRVRGQEFPIIRMEWIHGATLKDYIATQIHNPDEINRLADSFLQTVTDLHQHGISHGDLQDGNILVSSLRHLKLIDYDSLFVPSLRGSTNPIVGVPAYQHPQRFRNGNSGVAGEHIDYFSELVIYLSLRALAEQPRLWLDLKIEHAQGLIFSKEDFEQPAGSVIFRELSSFSREVAALADQLKTFCLATSLDQLRPLEEVVSQAKKGASTSSDDSLDKLRDRIKLLPQTPPTNATPGTVPTDVDGLIKKAGEHGQGQASPSFPIFPGPVIRIEVSDKRPSWQTAIRLWFTNFFREIKDFFSRKFASLQASGSTTPKSPSGPTPSVGIQDMAHKIKSSSPSSQPKLEDILAKVRERGS